MAILIDIKKKKPGFLLDVTYESLSGRIGILGASESGKSLLLKCIAGIERPEVGEIQIQGRSVYNWQKHMNLKPQKRKVGYLPSDYALFPNLSVEDNILCGYQGKSSEREQTILDYIRKFELTGLEDIKPEQLTDLAAFRTAVARMLIGNPNILLFDEPFLGREGYQKADLIADFNQYLKDYKEGYILTSGDPEDIYTLCEEVIILSRGKVLIAGKVNDVYMNPVTMEAAMMTGCRNFSSIEILDEYHVYAVDFGLALKTEQRVQPDMTHIGIRSQDLEGTENNSQNSLEIEILEKRESMYTTEYKVKNAQLDQSAALFWKADKKSSVPARLYFPPEKLMLLK